MTHIAYLILFLFPAFTVSGQITRNVCIAIALLCCHPKIVKKMAEPGFLLLTWFIWAIFCSYQSDSWLMSMFGFHRRFEGLNTWILALSFGWLFWRTSNLSRLYALLLLLMAICLFMMLWKPDIYGRIMFGHVAIAAFVTVACSMLMASRPLFALLSLPFIYLTQNRSIIIGIGLTMALYFILNNKAVRRKHLLITASCLILVCFLAWPKLKQFKPSEMGNGFRIQTAQKAIEFATLKPIIGYGVDTQSTLFGVDVNEFREIRPDETRRIRVPFSIDRCHNFFLDILIQTGVIGLILWLFILTRIVYRVVLCPSQINTACLYGVAGAIGFSLANPMGIPAIFLMCLCIIGIEKEEEVQL